MTVPTTDPIKALTESNALISASLAQELLTAANQIKSRAYCPYSRFRVGAAALVLPGSGSASPSSPTTTSSSLQDSSVSESPKLFSGANVENASYPVSTCAERCALGTAVAAGYLKVIAIAVSTDIDPPASPCGMCRQFIREFVLNEKVVIVMMGKKAGETDGREGSVVRKFGDVSFVWGMLTTEIRLLIPPCSCCP